jgi:hypothetical protein
VSRVVEDAVDDDMFRGKEGGKTSRDEGMGVDGGSSPGPARTKPRVGWEFHATATENLQAPTEKKKKVAK